MPTHWAVCRRDSKDDFLRETLVQDAVLRRIEIIGEAVKNLPADLKDAHTDIPWRVIARMRDHLIHRYFSVALDLTWQTIQGDIPDLERRVADIIRGMP